MTPNFKTCSRCKSEYPATLLFFRLRSKRSWKKLLTSWCRTCYKEYNQETAVKRQKRKTIKEWKKNNPDKVKTQNARHYQRAKRRKKYDKVADC